MSKYPTVCLKSNYPQENQYSVLFCIKKHRVVWHHWPWCVTLLESFSSAWKHGLKPVDKLSWGALTSTTSLVCRMKAPSCVEHQFSYVSCWAAVMFTAGRCVQNFTEPSNNISTDTFICVWYHTESVCSQESQPVTLMLHSGDMRKMGEKRFHFIIWFTSALRLLKLFRNVRLSDFLTSGETKQVCIHDL